MKPRGLGYARACCRATKFRGSGATACRIQGVPLALGSAATPTARANGQINVALIRWASRFLVQPLSLAAQSKVVPHGGSLSLALSYPQPKGQHKSSKSPLQGRDVPFRAPLVDLFALGIRSDWSRNPPTRYLCDEVVPPVAHDSVPFRGRMDAVEDERGWELGEIHSEDVLAFGLPCLHHRWNELLVLLCLGHLRGEGDGDDHGDEDDGVGALEEHLVDESAESMRGSVRIVAFVRYV